MHQTLIIGGGISGASALHWLASTGHDVRLIEASDALGGVIRSERREDGVLLERGPNSTQLKDPLIRQMIDELDLGARMIEANEAASKRFILRDGRPVATPTGPRDFLTTSLFRTSAKLRLIREPFIDAGPSEEDESVASFVSRRLGQEFLDYAIDPFVAGIYAGRPDRLSMRYTFPKVYDLEQRYGGLMRGMLGQRRARRDGARSGSPSGARGRLISFDEGMAVLPRELGRRWAEKITTGCRVERITREGDEWIAWAGGEIYRAERLILATEAYTAAELIEQIDSSLAAALRLIRYPPVGTAVVTFDREAVAHPLDGFGMLVPSREHRSILGVIFSSTLFPGRAPKDVVALTVFMGGTRQPQVLRADVAGIERLVIGELRDLFGIRGEARSFDCYIWPRAIPQYEVGYGDILRAIDDAEARNAGLKLLGNYRGGVSVGDCIVSAHSVLEQSSVG